MSPEMSETEAVVAERKRRHRTRRLNKLRDGSLAGFATVAAALQKNEPEIPPASSPDSECEVFELDPLDFPVQTNFSDFLFVPVSLTCETCRLRRNACNCIPRFACNFGILDKFLN